jgi:DNA-binding transcriptional MerR regulator
MMMTTTTPTIKIQIPDRLFFRIGDVARILGVKTHVLRYWESEFSIVAPRKSGSGQRVYRRADVETLALVRHLLHEERYSLEGARKRIKELRREGELSSYKHEVTSEAQVSSKLSAELAAKLDGLTRLIRRPISELFAF